MKLRNLCIVMAAAAGVAAPALADSSVNLGSIYDSGVTSQVGWNSSSTLSSTYVFTLSSAASTLDYTLHDITVQGLKMNIYKDDTLVQSVRVVNSGGDRGSEITGLTSGLYKITLTGTSIADYGQPGGGYELTLRSNAAKPVPGPAGALVAAAGAGVVAYRKRRARKLAEA